MQHLRVSIDYPLLPDHLFITSRFHHPVSFRRSYGKIGVSGVSKNKGFNIICWAVGKAREVFDESPLRKVENGSLFDDVVDDDELVFESLGVSDCEIREESNDFFVSDAEGDPDCPTEGYSSIELAIDMIRKGKFVIVVDDENVEGNLIMAASFITPKDVAFMMKHGSGIVSVAMIEEDLQRLKLTLMTPEAEQNDPSAPTFTVTVDAKTGTASGVSASDRARTILSLASPESTPRDFRRPGHVFPLKYRTGGVLRRAGHTEASMDLVTLAGLHPVSVLSALVDSTDGSIASLSDVRNLAMEYNLPIVTIADLIRYRRKREKLVERTIVSPLLTRWGLFQTICYQSKLDGTEHLAMVKGDIGDGHDVLLIEEAGRGVVIYLRGHEGRGIGLGHKLSAYNLQDLGHDTVDANLELGLAVDSREYGIGAQMLRDMGVRTMRLMTNNPAKFTGLKGYGLAVTGRVPVLTPVTEENKRYLETKRTKMGHIYGSDIQGPLSGFISPSADRKNQLGQSSEDLIP
ncbi:unnamed protein product [Rhodiola kirilowii]